MYYYAHFHAPARNLKKKLRIGQKRRQPEKVLFCVPSAAMEGKEPSVGPVRGCLPQRALCNFLRSVRCFED